MLIFKVILLCECILRPPVYSWWNWHYAQGGTGDLWNTEEELTLSGGSENGVAASMNEWISV